MLSGNVVVMSGMPKTCLGYYGADESNPGLAYSGGLYHFCKGKPFSPGDEHQPWTYRLDLSAEYRPEWAGKKLAFNVMVYNVFNKQTTLQTYAMSGYTNKVNPSYLRPYASQTPRYVRFGVSYDF
jgi:outer membrane receptor protein involved in Fe transport